jgi:hypothetical protein
MVHPGPDDLRPPPTRGPGRPEDRAGVGDPRPHPHHPQRDPRRHDPVGDPQVVDQKATITGSKNRIRPLSGRGRGLTGFSFIVLE